ncbi:MAG: universal stress protein [Bacteroidia bacterium]|nr:universal stress protein [Bacteroidia bacterium]MDW8157414.1 universal stress protein [Bacteroidia bacterium]
MKKILFPTDFSEGASNAMQFLLQQFRYEPIEITLFHAYHLQIVDPFTHQEMISMMEKELRCSAEEKLEEMKHKVLKELPAAHVTCVTRLGLAVDEIIEYSRQNSIELIIMGTVGATGLSELLIGSNTAKVIEHAHCPVLAIPLHYRSSRLPTEKLRVVYACDFLDLDLYSFLQLNKFLILCNGELHLIHITDSREQLDSNFVKELTDFLRNTFNKLEIELIAAPDVLQGIKEYAEKNPQQVLAMTTHKRTFLDKLYSRSITTKMAFHTQTPLLALHKYRYRA